MSAIRLRLVAPAVVREQYWTRGEFHRGAWPGDHHTFWLAMDGATAAGFCSAYVIPRYGECYLSSAAVFGGRRGRGLQRRMIRHRLQWAKRRGATHAITYAMPFNWPSIANLLRCGFHVYDPAYAWAGRDLVYLQRQLAAK